MSVSSRLIATRSLRGLADGVVSVLLPAHLAARGLGTARVGTVVTATLLGSAALTLLVGLGRLRLSRRQQLLGAAGLMALTGALFALPLPFWLLLVVAAVGTLNPSSGDVSVFLPLEQAALAEGADGAQLARRYARWNVAGALGGALGALLCALPKSALGLSAQDTTWAFWLYAALGLCAVPLFAGLPPSPPPTRAVRAPLEKSREVVVRLTLLFCLDSAGSGLVLDALLALWMSLRFGFELQTLGTIFFVARLLASFSQLLSPVLARRFGPVRTMVFTHLPGNLALAAAAFAPSAEWAVALLLLRTSLSRMDAPIRQALVMDLVPREEREAAAAVTNVPRSLASAATPALAGLLLEQSTFGWPLVLAGLSKALYDLLLLAGVRAFERPPR